MPLTVAELAKLIKEHPGSSGKINFDEESLKTQIIELIDKFSQLKEVVLTADAPKADSPKADNEEKEKPGRFMQWLTSKIDSAQGDGEEKDSSILFKHLLGTLKQKTVLTEQAKESAEEKNRQKDLFTQIVLYTHSIYYDGKEADFLASVFTVYFDIVKLERLRNNSSFMSELKKLVVEAKWNDAQVLSFDWWLKDLAALELEAEMKAFKNKASEIRDKFRRKFESEQTTPLLEEQQKPDVSQMPQSPLLTPLSSQPRKDSDGSDSSESSLATVNLVDVDLTSSGSDQENVHDESKSIVVEHLKKSRKNKGTLRHRKSSDQEQPSHTAINLTKKEEKGEGSDKTAANADTPTPALSYPSYPVAEGPEESERSATKKSKRKGKFGKQGTIRQKQLEPKQAEKTHTDPTPDVVPVSLVLEVPTIQSEHTVEGSVTLKKNEDSGLDKGKQETEIVQEQPSLLTDSLQLLHGSPVTSVQTRPSDIFNILAALSSGTVAADRDVDSDDDSDSDVEHDPHTETPIKSVIAVESPVILAPVPVVATLSALHSDSEEKNAGNVVTNPVLQSELASDNAAEFSLFKEKIVQARHEIQSFCQKLQEIKKIHAVRKELERNLIVLRKLGNSLPGCEGTKNETKQDEDDFARSFEERLEKFYLEISESKNGQAYCQLQPDVVLQEFESLASKINGIMFDEKGQPYRELKLKKPTSIVIKKDYSINAKALAEELDLQLAKAKRLYDKHASAQMILQSDELFNPFVADIQKKLAMEAAKGDVTQAVKKPYQELLMNCNLVLAKHSKKFSRRDQKDIEQAILTLNAETKNWTSLQTLKQTAQAKVKKTAWESWGEGETWTWKSLWCGFGVRFVKSAVRSIVNNHQARVDAVMAKVALEWAKDNPRGGIELESVLLSAHTIPQRSIKQRIAQYRSLNIANEAAQAANDKCEKVKTIRETFQASFDLLAAIKSETRSNAAVIEEKEQATTQQKLSIAKLGGKTQVDGQIVEDSIREKALALKGTALISRPESGNCVLASRDEVDQHQTTESRIEYSISVPG